MVEGTAEVIEGGAPKLLNRLGKRYLGADVDVPPMPDPPEGSVTQITPSWIHGVGPWTD